MSFTQEFVDFTGLSDPEIKTKLLELNIPLTAEEALNYFMPSLCFRVFVTF